MIAWLTGDGRFDAIGTLCIGAVLIAVAVFLAVEVKSLLLGEAADPALLKVLDDVAKQDPQISGVLRARSVYSMVVSTPSAWGRMSTTRPA